MSEEEDLVKLKFRLYDGSDIGPLQYSADSTITMLKERIVSEWPQGGTHLCNYTLTRKRITPKTANDVRLICGGKILENNKTVGQCRTPFGELPGGIITMHVVVQPSTTKTEKKVEKLPKKSICSCSVL